MRSACTTNRSPVTKAAAGSIRRCPTRSRLRTQATRHGSARRRAPRDVLPPESDRWAALIATFAERASRFGFDLVVTPIFEHLEVFQRVGESTDVVRKEMYEFEDKGGRRLALRPEGTAPVVRAFVQHHPPVPWKVWYLAPHFRYERPQKGRYRQHWQVGRRSARGRRSRCRRRGDRARRRLLPRPRARALQALPELDG